MKSQNNRLLKKYKLKKGFKPGELIERSRIKRQVVNRKSGNGTLAKTDFIGDKAKKVTVYKKEHKKDKSKTENRMIDTMAHEEMHVKHPKMSEKEVYKAVSVKKMKQMSKKQKARLYAKYSKKKKKKVTMTKKEAVREHQKLVKVLKNPTKKNLAKEAKEQSKELREYKQLRKC